MLSTGIAMKSSDDSEPPRSPIQAFEKAADLAEKLKFKEALRTLLPAIDALPKSFREQAYMLMATCYDQMGDTLNAIEWAKKALAETGNPELHFHLGFIYLKRDDLVQAAQHLCAYLKLAPEGEFADAARRLLSFRQEALEKIRRHAPQLSEEEAEEVLRLRDQATMLVEQGRGGEAVDKLKSLIERMPDDLTLRNNLTVALLSMGRRKEAVREAEKVLERDPNNLHALCNLAVLNWMLGNKDCALVFAAKAKRADGSAYRRFEKLSECLQMIEDDRGLYDLCKERLEEDPSDRTAQWTMAVAAANLGRFREAKALFRRAQPAYPHLEKVFAYRLRQLEAMRRGLSSAPRRLDYQFTMDDLQKAGLEPDEMAQVIKLNPSIKMHIIWLIDQRGVTMKFKEMAMEILGKVGSDDVEQFLREFVKRTEENDELKIKALVALKEMGAKPPYEAYIQGEMRQLQIFSSEIPPDASPKAIEVATEIMDLAKQLSWLENWTAMADAATDIWTSYLQAIDPEEPIIERPQDWAIACWALAADELDLEESVIDRIVALAGKTAGREDEIYDIMEEIDLTLAESEGGLSEEELEEERQEVMQEALEVLKDFADKSLDELVEIAIGDLENAMFLGPFMEKKIKEEVKGGRAEHAIELLETLISRIENWKTEGPKQEQSKISNLESFYYLLALACQEAGRNAEAVKALEAGLRVAEGPMIWYQFGRLRLAEGDLEEAAACWRRAVQMNPTNFYQVLEIAQTFLELNRLDRAEEFLKAALDRKELEKGRIELMDMLAEVYQRKGDVASFNATVTNILQLRPLSSQEMILWARRAIQTNRKIQALSRLKEWAEEATRAPGSQTANLLLALIYLDLGKTKQAQQRLCQWKEAWQGRDWLLEADWRLMEKIFPDAQLVELRRYL